jgi:serine/threonine protein kinase/TPR repeat protein
MLKWDVDNENPYKVEISKMTGKTISHYKILEKLGEGGMGVVYKAEDTRLDRIVALKFLAKHFLSDEEAKFRFENEAKAASVLNHPHITTIYEIDEVAGDCFISMEYVEGKSVKELSEEKNLTIEQILKIAIQIGEGLDAAHKKGIIHRDIKSDNIMVTAEGLVKIMDFGLAKLRRVSKVTKQGTTLGTIPYMSPEQLQGIETDQRSDIFSYGVVLYEMITGQLPFRGGYEASVIYSIVHDTPEPLAKYKANVPEGLQRVVDKTLAKEKDERYQHVDEMMEDLYAVQQQKQPALKIQKNVAKIPLIIAGIVIILVLMVFSYFFLWPKSTTVSEKSIAVLPFIDMSPQKDQEYFCDGMTDELINRLSNVQGLKVPARTSVFTFKGKTPDIRDVGGKLNVRTVLEGSVQKSGNQLRIIAQLIDVTNGYHLWSEKYDRELKDIFTIQDDISSAIVGALQLKLTSEERQRMSERPLDNATAYECYLRANYEIWRFKEEALDRAVQELKNAVEIAGPNPFLYSAIAEAYRQYVNIGARQEDFFIKAEDYAKKALALNPNFSKAYIVLGYIYEGKNQQEGIHYFKKALAVNPNEPDALRRLTLIYLDVGKRSAAFPLMERLKKTDPLNPSNYLLQGYSYLYNGQFGLALDPCRKWYQSDPENPVKEFFYALTLVYNKAFDEAFSVIEKCAEAEPNNLLSKFGLLLKYGQLKDREKAFLIMTPDFRKTCQRDLEWSYFVADAFALLHENNEAFYWLENAVDRGFINYTFINNYDPFLDTLRGEERFKKLMERVKYRWEHFEE